MTLNFFSQIDYASFKDGKSKEQDDGKQKILKKKQKNKHNKGTKGSKKGKKKRDAQEDLNRIKSLGKVLVMLVTQSLSNNPTHPPYQFRTHIAEISSLGLLTPTQKFLKKRVFSHFHKFRTLDPHPPIV